MKVQLTISQGVKQIYYINPKNLDKLKEKYGEDLKILE